MLWFWAFLAVDNFDFTRKIVKKNLVEIEFLAFLDKNLTFRIVWSRQFYLKDLHRIFSGFRVAPKSSFAAKWPSEWDWKRPEWIMPRPSRHPCISGKWIASRHNLYSRWIVTCLRPICPSHREERPSPKGLWLQWCYHPSHYPKKESQKTDAEYRWFIIIH